MLDNDRAVAAWVRSQMYREEDPPRQELPAPDLGYVLDLEEAS